MNVKSASILSRTHQAYIFPYCTYSYFYRSVCIINVLSFHYSSQWMLHAYPTAIEVDAFTKFLYSSRTSSSDWHVFYSCFFSDILSMPWACSSKQYETNSRAAAEICWLKAELANKAKSLFRGKSDKRNQWSASLDWLTVYELQHSDKVYSECVLPDMGRSSTHHAATSSHYMHFVELSRALYTVSTQ
jgi:hypothetical protein